MKVYFLAIILLVAAIGCISRDIEKDEFQEIYDFSTELEAKTNLSDENEILNFRENLNEKYMQLQGDSRDVLASKKFLEFRMSLLDSQRHTLISEMLLEECSVEISINHLENSIESITHSMLSFEDFKNDFPEYFEITRMTNETLENLESILHELTETVEFMQENKDEIC